MTKYISLWHIFRIFLKMGLVSFGGPAAHLAYLRNEFVVRRRWVDDHTYADLMALCQLLPGPASSQMGMAMGMLKRGVPGAMVAWLGFALPMTILLMLFGYSLSEYGAYLNAGWIHGLKLATVVVVAQAVWSMTVTLCSTNLSRAMMLLSAAVILVWATLYTQFVVIFAGGLLGYMFFPGAGALERMPLQVRLNRKIGIFSIFLFFELLIILPFIAVVFPSHAMQLVNSFYWVGSMVFGGGQVVLPLLQTIVVHAGWVSNELLLAGYGMAQALPGPLFGFAAYLGFMMNEVPNGVLGGLICLFSIYLPTFLLMIGILPFYDKFRQLKGIRSALAGINATVVGILLAAFFNPILINAVQSIQDLCVALVLFLVFHYFKIAPWMLVMSSAMIMALLYKI